ncbi:MAG TPA: energy transducer TonB [Halieaceae bacterium]|jgi:protein TonB|uniref:energy transducer TonB n=1 Tax=Haliea TaxID=475794 RepID=UPI000C5210F9|nr:energy transducer TonB [Haliea sp.]HAN69440.1 energy transducer TonB [Halieaceae bacterium]MAD64066.1 energy transducer TonB [Haliea sp.]MAY92471.1 energy transducer TonB [Haliea sp.]MBK40901.1 energy transducer TonB [Haliea sp.]MBP68524.1 energy transducer TonB [Haliea sp.]|tara:strand:+ start:3383 stop:3988 length:606 start_codon:yes stop_codon:yes gene_type:complete
MGSSFVRVLVGALVAIPVAIGLFFVMQSLISREYQQEDIESRKIADIVVPETEIEVNVAQKKPEKVEDPEEPPPELDTPDMDMDMDMNVVNTAPRASVDVSINSSGMSSGDGEYLPIVKVAPVYPRRAQTRGISGYCIVEYTVTRNGSIRDPRAVDCQPSGVFESASVKAAEKFKYKPRVVDGEPIEVAGVQNKFTYELEQ